MGLLRRTLLAAVCFATSVGGLCFYPKTSAPDKSKTSVTAKSRKRHFKDLVSVGGSQIHKDLVKIVEEVKKFKVRTNDVFIVTFPKSGTTWVQEIVLLVTSDLDFEGAKSRNLDERSPFLEFPCPGLGAINAMTSPRVIKTHLSRDLLPDEIPEKRPKIIYVARNPRDVSVSYYHFCTKLEFVNYKGSFAEFFEEFMNGTVPYGPWWRHVSDFWSMRNQSNLLFITYEDLHAENHETIRKIAKYLGKSLSEAEVRKISEHCQFDQMSANRHVNYRWLEDMGLAKPNVPFMRQGKVGDWKHYLSSDMCERMDDLVAEIDDQKDEKIKFTYELGRDNTR